MIAVPPAALRDGIPGFVTRGLMTLADPRDITSVRYANEADLRDALALSWWLAGWSVRTEVKVPDCGRIDVLAEGGGEKVIIELKKRIDTTGQARAAFQQAHAYASYLTGGLPESARTYVTAGSLDRDAVQSAMRAFPYVECFDFLSVASLAGYPWPRAADMLARLARNRRDELKALADLSAGAAAVITNRAEMHLMREEDAS